MAANSMLRYGAVRSGLLALGAAALLSSSSCGGKDTIASLANFYQGLWSGNWSSTTLQNGGSMDVTIDSTGVMTGSMGNNVVGTSGDVDVTVESNGHFTGSVDFADSPDYTLQGTLVKTSEGKILATFSVVYQGDVYGASSEWTPKSSGGETTGE